VPETVTEEPIVICDTEAPASVQDIPDTEPIHAVLETDTRHPPQYVLPVTDKVLPATAVPHAVTLDPSLVLPVIDTIPIIRELPIQLTPDPTRHAWLTLNESDSDTGPEQLLCDPKNVLPLIDRSLTGPRHVDPSTENDEPAITVSRIEVRSPTIVRFPTLKLEPIIIESAVVNTLLPIISD
jgi:hypothetical protein